MQSVELCGAAAEPLELVGEGEAETAAAPKCEKLVLRCGDGGAEWRVGAEWTRSARRRRRDNFYGILLYLINLEASAPPTRTAPKHDNK